ncbi:MAG: DUF2309 domain-containing protein [Acidobacteria bacterium]|nr:DUF2309 domain-containing protein [Acidobacteriota bacterium]
MSEHSNPKEHLRHVIHHVAHFLPAQGPIGVFIHHNTLHAFQHMPFEKAVAEASQIFKTEPYMTEDAYKACLRNGRMREQDIDAVLEREVDAGIVPGLTRRELWRAMLHPGVRTFDPVGIAWRMEEGDLAEDFRSSKLRALFDACLARTEEPDHKRAPSARAADEIVHPLLIRLSSVYLDQGMSYWPMPGRKEGFYGAVRKLLSQSMALFPKGLIGLDEEFRGQTARNMDAEDVVISYLGPDQNSWEPKLLDELMALPGWPGLFSVLENDPALFPHDPVPCKLVDFLAVRLTMAKVAAEHAGAAPPAEPVDPHRERLARAAALYEAARVSKQSADTVSGWTPQRWSRFVVEAESFDNLERRRVYHQAYERWHEQEILLGLASHRQYYKPAKRRMRPAAQVFFCIDEREESIRRALEEVDPMVDTYSAAGFYAVAVDYKGIDDAHGVALCPVVMKPQHAVREKPTEEDVDLHEQRVVRRRLWARISRALFVSSRSLVRGALSTAVLGTLSSVPLIARILAPRRYGLLREALNRAFFPEPRTEVTLMRNDADSHNRLEGLLLGFTIAEKADRVAGVLVPAGLTTEFARMVVTLGHGSTSLNNPHESAHDCGACGGRRGGPNGRMFAAMANRPEVRQELVSRGVTIPADTWFVGGYHDTCSDDVVLYDLDLVPPSHEPDLNAIRQSLDLARARSAQERARRFESCADDADPTAALWHVEERSEHLAQPRPEYGHCTNSVTMVGRRETTRGLFMDRRAFLVSYDPLIDPQAENLAKLMAAVVPVCGGISLEYYFSFVDNERYGCGTKLPHNVTGLIGVMNGQSSDLRTGLPLQMVEIHEPVRSLFCIETTPDLLEKVIAGNPTVKEFIVNRWIRISVMDPLTGQIQIRRDNGYEPLEGEVKPLPTAPNSHAWYKGKLEHLPMAMITPPQPITSAGAGRSDS